MLRCTRSRSRPRGRRDRRGTLPCLHHARPRPARPGSAPELSAARGTGARRPCRGRRSPGEQASRCAGRRPRTAAAAAPPGHRRSTAAGARRRRSDDRRATAKRRRPAAAPRAGPRRAGTGRWSHPLVVVALGTLLVAAALVPSCCPVAARSPAGSRTTSPRSRSPRRPPCSQQADHYRRWSDRRRAPAGPAEGPRRRSRRLPRRVAAQRAVVGRTAAELYRAVPGLAPIPVLAPPLPTPPPTTPRCPQRPPSGAAGTAPRRPRRRSTPPPDRVGRSADHGGRRGHRREAETHSSPARCDRSPGSARRSSSGWPPSTRCPRAGAEQARNAAGRRPLAGLPGLARRRRHHSPVGRRPDRRRRPALRPLARPRPGRQARPGRSPGRHRQPARSRCCPPRPSPPSAPRCPSSASPTSAGTSGPATYDCGGFTAATWLLGGLRPAGDPAGAVGRGHRRPAEPGPGRRPRVLPRRPGRGHLPRRRRRRRGLGRAPTGSASAGVARRLHRRPGDRCRAPGSPNAPLAGAARTGTCGAPLPPPGLDDPGLGRLTATGRSRRRRCASSAWPTTCCAATRRRPTAR